MAKAKKVELTINERVLATINVSYDHGMLAWFKPHIAKWSPEYMGPLPTAAMLWFGAATAKLGAGKQAGFVGCQLREGGMSVAQLAAAFNSGPAHNHTRDDLVKPGYFTRTKTGSGNGAAQTFALIFTPQGEKLCAELAAAHGVLASTKKPKAPKADKPVSVKPRTNKQKAPVAEPVAEPAPVAEPVAELVADQPTAEQFAALAAQYNS